MNLIKVDSVKTAKKAKTIFSRQIAISYDHDYFSFSLLWFNHEFCIQKMIQIKVIFYSKDVQNHLQNEWLVINVRSCKNFIIFLFLSNHYSEVRNYSEQVFLFSFCYFFNGLYFFSKYIYKCVYDLVKNLNFTIKLSIND